MPNEIVSGLNDPSRGDFNNQIQPMSGKQEAQKADKEARREESKKDENNTQSAGYDSRKTHSAKNESGSSTSAKQ